MEQTQHSATSAAAPAYGDVPCPIEQAELSAGALSERSPEEITLLELRDEDLRAVAGGRYSRNPYKVTSNNSNYT